MAFARSGFRIDFGPDEEPSALGGRGGLAVTASARESRTEAPPPDATAIGVFERSTPRSRGISVSAGTHQELENRLLGVEAILCLVP